MNAVHACQICKEEIQVTADNPDLSALEHLSTVHGIIVPAEPNTFWSESDQLANERLDRYLLSIKGSRINN